MPRSCCTCHDDQLLEQPIAIENRDRFHHLKHLVERIQREQTIQPKLVASLNLLEHRIHTLSNTTSTVPMEIDHGKGSRVQKKNTKAIHSGTFLFLPYSSAEKASRSSDVYSEVLKTAQRGRFIGRTGHIPSLEREHHVCINMVTAKTMATVKQALEQAKNGSENFRVHTANPEILNTAGEWILIRHKNSPKETSSADFQQVLDDLTNRWQSCLTIKKRKFGDGDGDEWARSLSFCKY